MASSRRNLPALVLHSLNSVPGKTRLFYRWQGKNLADKDWILMGIAMLADSNLGETEGGLQAAPFVLKENSVSGSVANSWPERVFEKCYVDARRFSMRRMVARSIIVSEI
ncbi:MAG TPA: hypothetical protein VGG97_13520 [Bryobacteraceae bacterium]